MIKFLSSLLNRTGAEIVIKLIKNANKSFLLLKKFKNTESAQLCVLVLVFKVQFLKKANMDTLLTHKFPKCPIVSIEKNHFLYKLNL